MTDNISHPYLSQQNINLVTNSTVSPSCLMLTLEGVSWAKESILMEENKTFFLLYDVS